MEKYDKIGRHYNATRKADLYLADKFVQFLQPKEIGKYLDIGCGTGNYTIELNKQGLDFIGVDPSLEMLNNAINRNSNVVWKIGRSEHIPLEDKIVDGILASLTIHHWEDLDKSFRELNRVLKQEGRIVIFTSTSTQMNGYWLNHYFPKMLRDSMDTMPKIDVIKSHMTNCGFEVIEIEKYFVREDLADLFLYAGKHNPKFYLDLNIRNGISSFSDLANANEVETGLNSLRADIETGRIAEIVEKYRNEQGDYLFVIGKKSRDL